MSGLLKSNLVVGVGTALSRLTGLLRVAVFAAIVGRTALSDAYDMERNVRDLLGMPIVGGSSDMQKNNLAALWRLPS